MPPRGETDATENLCDQLHFENLGCWGEIFNGQTLVRPDGRYETAWEAMGDIDYVDLTKTPLAVADMLAMAASNAAHLASTLKASAFPGISRK